MKILQQLPARCTCALCDMGCQCGDCSACSKPVPAGSMSRTVKRLSIAACLLLISGGFVFFVPVVALAATPAVAESISLNVQPANNATQPMGSIGYCYFGVGAVLVHGWYYPSVPLNQSARHICK